MTDYQHDRRPHNVTKSTDYKPYYFKYANGKN